MKSVRQADFAALVQVLGSEELPHLKGMGRRERKAAETRVRLFRCAVQLFAEHGFANVTVEDITEAADVGKGTFFNYFASKDHVLSVMPEIQLGKVREALQAAEEGKRPIRSVVHDLFIKISEEPGRSPEMARAVLTAFLSTSIREQLGKNISQGRRLLARIFELGQQRGEIDPTLKTEQLGLHLQQSFLGTMLLWSLGSDQKLHAVVEASFQHFWRAIARN
ncbi:MAG TPA: TetR/AcrR family transcriptional regulator [Candidatus Sulfotelmatobacter sp.]|nr:TetR/AcrR family transcriptional regulator [Candidatus Sulfotelmatobacter sp.]